MIKVLHIMTDATLGGAGRVLLQLLSCIDRSRFDVTVAAPSGSELVEQVQRLGFPVIQTQRGHDRSFERGAVQEYKKIIAGVKPDIVHTHSSFAGKVAAWLSGVPARISTRHCAYESVGRTGRFPFKQLNGLVNNTLSTAFIAVAHTAAQNLVDTGIDPKKVRVIINGVEPLPQLTLQQKLEFRRSLGYEPQDFICLVSARLEPTKGHEMLIDAALQVCQQVDRRVRFIFMGDGSCRANIEQKIQQCNAVDLVRLTGFVHDVAPYYNICDCVINGSFEIEASSLALAEGMSLQKPSVVTDCGGNPYMITHGVNGLVVPQRDPAAMADALVRLITEPELYETLQTGAGQEYQQKFTARAMTARVEELYFQQTRKEETK